MINYKVFFSYQSDTKGNKKFILDALILAKNLFKEENIDLTIDEGMRDTAGNSQLLDVMLRKGSDCDIFIADLTYVVKFKNSAGNEKSVPNPNVMLELGHAWNFHKDEQTIFIQNIVHGKSEDLPVDLKGFRFPVRFILEENEEKTSKETKKNELAVDLYNAIKSSITSIDESRKTKFLPFEKFIHWKPNEKYEFITTDYFDFIANEINKLLHTQQYVTVYGESGSGKSRIVKESILQFFTGQEINDIYYCDILSSTISEINGKFKEIKYSLQRSTTFIIDNCTESDITIVKRILYESPANCLFIISDKYKGDINIEKKKYINQVLSQNSKGHEIVEKCGYDLHLIFAELHNEKSDITISQINKKHNILPEQEKLVKYLSLFSKVGFYDGREVEFNLFCGVFKFNKDQSVETVDDLISNKLLVRKAGFIYFEADRIAELYSCELWEQNSLSEFSISKFSESPNLINSFINRQAEVHKKSGEAKQFLRNYIKTELRDNAMLDTIYGNHSVYKLSEYFPKEILLSLEIATENSPGYTYSQFSGINWSLDRIYRNKLFFRRTGNLLLQLAKNKMERRDIVNLIKEHFFISDDIDYDTRIGLLEDFYKKDEFDLVFDIYLESFKKEPIIDIANVESEKIAYLTHVIESLKSKREKHKERIDSLIVDIIPAACNLGLSKEVFLAVKLITKENNVNKYIYAKLIHTKDILSGSRFKNDRRILNRIITRINDKNVRNLLYGKVILSRLEWEKSLDERIQIMDDFVQKLIARGDDEWLRQIDVLLKAGKTYNGNAILFGKVLLKHYSNYELLINRCLDAYKAIPIEEQSFGFIVGLLQSKINDDYSEFREFRDTLLVDSILVHCGIAISNYLPTNIDDLHKVKNAIIKFDLPFKLINLSSIDLSNTDIEVIIKELIEYSKDAADVSLLMLDNTWQFHKIQGEEKKSTQHLFCQEY